MRADMAQKRPSSCSPTVSGMVDGMSSRPLVWDFFLAEIGVGIDDFKGNQKSKFSKSNRPA
jgi:hypothetical protein